MVGSGSRTDDPLPFRNVRGALIKETFGVLPPGAMSRH